MKHKTLFRLALKAIGILLLGFSVPQLVEMAALAVWFSSERSLSGRAGWTGYEWFYSLGRPIGGMLQVAFALYLLFGGKWIVDRCIPSNRPYCPECGYDLSSSGGDRCVECGVALPADLRGRAGQQEADVQ